jgi:hypothetical protein
VSEFIGKMVRLQNGVVCGPIKERHPLSPMCKAYPLTDGVYTWTADGKNVIGGPDNEYDIVEAVDFARSPPFAVNTDGVVLTDNPSFGRIYLAGPMAGYPERNYPAFMRAAKALRDLGYEVYNPAEYETSGTDEFPLREAFTEYANYILNRADIIALLPGYENSVGATAELSLARVVKLKEIYL